MTFAKHGSLWDQENVKDKWSESLSFDKRGGENTVNISYVYNSTVHNVTHRVNQFHDSYFMIILFVFHSNLNLMLNFLSVLPM